MEDERARISDIDALTVPGYEAMAEEAKAAGTSAIDFQKQVVAAMKKKGADFIKARQDETAPAKDVAGGAPKDSARDEEEELKDAAKGIQGPDIGAHGGTQARRPGRDSMGKVL